MAPSKSKSGPKKLVPNNANGNAVSDFKEKAELSFTRLDQSLASTVMKLPTILKSHKEKAMKEFKCSKNQASPNFRSVPNEKKVKALTGKKVEYATGGGDAENNKTQTSKVTENPSKLQLAERGIHHLVLQINKFKEMTLQKEEELRFLSQDVAKIEIEMVELLHQCEETCDLRRDLQDMNKEIAEDLKSKEDEVAKMDLVDTERDILVTIESETFKAEDAELCKAEERIEVRLGALKAASSLLQYTLKEAQNIKDVSSQLNDDRLYLEEKFQYARNLGVLSAEDVQKVKDCLRSGNGGSQKQLSRKSL